MNLPLCFSFKQLVSGNGFIAGVRMNGRALLEECDDGTESWISGVAPVGIAAGGADRGEAYTAFRNAWVAVLFDIAAESNSFEAFKSGCDEFLTASTPAMTEMWTAALEEVRRAKYVDPKLKKETAKQIGHEVVDLTERRHNSAENEIELGLQTAA